MSEERKRILQMIEKGLITADEAEELLNALDDAEKLKDEKQNVSKQVKWDDKANEKQKNHKEKNTQSTKHKIFDFIDNTLQKIKNADLDFNFGPYAQVSHIFQHQNVTFSTFSFDIDNGSVELSTWDENEIRVECKAKVYREEDEQEAKKHFLNKLEMDTNDNHFKIKLDTKKIKADFVIYVPNHIYEKGEIRLFNGHVAIKDFESNHLKVKTSNGRIHFKRVKGDEWDIKGVNSNIKLENVVCSDCEVETINGSIHLDGVFGKVDSQLVNGSINAYWRGHEGHTGFFKTTTGSVHLFLPDDQAIDGELKASIGSVHCNLTNYEPIKKENELLKKQLHFQTKGTFNDTLYVEAETKTGSIKINPLQ